MHLSQRLKNFPIVSNPPRNFSSFCTNKARLQIVLSKTLQLKQSNRMPANCAKMPWGSKDKPRIYMHCKSWMSCIQLQEEFWITVRSKDIIFIYQSNQFILPFDCQFREDLQSVIRSKLHDLKVEDVAMQGNRVAPVCMCSFPLKH